MRQLKLALDITLDYKMTTGIEVSKVGGDTGSPWMVVYVALIPGLLKSTCFRIVEDHKFFVP